MNLIFTEKSANRVLSEDKIELESIEKCFKEHDLFILEESSKWLRYGQNDPLKLEFHDFVAVFRAIRLLKFQRKAQVRIGKERWPDTDLPNKVLQLLDKRKDEFFTNLENGFDHNIDKLLREGALSRKDAENIGTIVRKAFHEVLVTFGDEYSLFILDDTEAVSEPKLGRNSTITEETFEKCFSVWLDQYLRETSKNEIKHNKENTKPSLFETLGIIPLSFIIGKESNSCIDVSETEFGVFFKLLTIRLNELLYKSISSALEIPGPVLLEGPTGSGKTAFASTLALEKKLRFNSTNIANERDDLVQAKLNGILKNQYTGVEACESIFGQTAGGVVFLDEAQNISAKTQTTLLTMLSAHDDVVKVSKDQVKVEPVPVKTIIGSNESVNALVNSEKWRRDFRWRIRKTVQLPSLNECMERLFKENEEEFKSYVMILFWTKIQQARGSYSILNEGVKSRAELENSIFGKSNDDELKELLAVAKLDEASIEVIRELSWNGNYREFESYARDFSFEVFHKRKYGFGEYLKQRHSEVGEIKGEDDSELFDTPLNVLVRLVGYQLNKHHYNRKQTADGLKPFISSTNTLNSFVKKHWGLFNEKTRTGWEKSSRGSKSN